jgi:hypothetical protein
VGCAFREARTRPAGRNRGLRARSTSSERDGARPAGSRPAHLGASRARHTGAEQLREGGGSVGKSGGAGGGTCKARASACSWHQARPGPARVLARSQPPAY